MAMQCRRVNVDYSISPGVEYEMQPLEIWSKARTRGKRNDNAVKFHHGHQYSLAGSSNYHNYKEITSLRSATIRDPIDDQMADVYLADTM